MRLAATSLFIVVAIGCGSRTPVPVEVSGSVKLDDKPLAEGKISFVTNGKVPEMLDVTNGRFSGKVMPGERRVEIAAYRPYQIPPEVPESMHALMASGKENYLPKKYHSDSTLSATVQPTGGNEFNFDLSSKGE